MIANVISASIVEPRIDIVLPQQPFLLLDIILLLFLLAQVSFALLLHECTRIYFLPS